MEIFIPAYRDNCPVYSPVAGLALCGIIPLLKKCISDHRHNTEIKPIVNAMRENFARKEAVIEGATGRIFVLTASDSVHAGYQWYNGYYTLPNDSLLFRVRLTTPEGRTVFSRDTSVGQVVCLLIHKNDSTEREEIFGIYFNPGTDEPDRNNMNLRRAMIYAGEPGYALYFIADSFDKDPHSVQGMLAQQRLRHINEVLIKKKTIPFQIKKF